MASAIRISYYYLFLLYPRMTVQDKQNFTRLEIFSLDRSSGCRCFWFNGQTWFIVSRPVGWSKFFDMLFAANQSDMFDNQLKLHSVLYSTHTYQFWTNLHVHERMWCIADAIFCIDIESLCHWFQINRFDLFIWHVYWISARSNMLVTINQLQTPNEKTEKAKLRYDWSLHCRITQQHNAENHRQLYLPDMWVAYYSLRNLDTSFYYRILIRKSFVCQRMNWRKKAKKIHAPYRA